jgi:hypothetical protein
LCYIEFVHFPAIYETETARKAKIDGEKTAREVNEYLKKYHLPVNKNYIKKGYRLDTPLNITLIL